MPGDENNPRSGKRTIEIPFLWLVKRADPTWQQDRRKEIEYEFASGKAVKTANPENRGAYLDERDIFDPYE